jgi:hypothetical protein
VLIQLLNTWPSFCKYILITDLNRKGLQMIIALIVMAILIACNVPVIAKLVVVLVMVGLIAWVMIALGGVIIGALGPVLGIIVILMLLA